MDTNPFLIEFKYKGQTLFAEVKPCCQEDNIFYYDIIMENQYQFTITPAAKKEKSLLWKISLKNADNHVDEELIRIIGVEIEKQYL
jgi:hypothetical protein